MGKFKMEKYKSIYGFKKPKLSPCLELFFIELSSWAKAGYPENKVFDKKARICCNLGYWIEWNVATVSRYAKSCLYKEFRDIRYSMFLRNGPLAPAFPFETGKFSVHRTLIGMANPVRVDFIHTLAQNN